MHDDRGRLYASVERYCTAGQIYAVACGQRAGDGDGNTVNQSEVAGSKVGNSGDLVGSNR